VVSLASQQAFVFKNGELWDSTPVSTGKRGNEILQKKVHHRSSLYDDAPMPYMQRLTWDGVALHAGRVSGYPASHGCIRLPAGFAKKLYQVTGFSSTIVLVTDEPVGSVEAARELA
jgi:lipoprotein-anchoring transpeptidase ErfK/SrfK